MAVFSGAELVIGRSAYCSMTIDHPSVSRVHAALRRVEDRVELTDLGSMNGTFVNGERLKDKPCAVTMTDQIKIGRVPLHLEEAEALDAGSTWTKEGSVFSNEDTTSKVDVQEPGGGYSRE